MKLFLVALVGEILNDFYKFFKFWYIDSLRYFFNEYVKNIAIIEKRFSIRLNLKNFFAPLYGFRSIESYFYAIPLRTILILISVFLHLLNTFITALILLFWSFLPLFLTFIIYKWSIG